MRFKSFREFMDEDAPTTSVAGGGVDLAPSGKQVVRMDRRSRWDPEKMYKRATGTVYKR